MKEDIKVPYLMYNAMFKSVFRKNPNVLKRLVELVLEENDIHLNLEDKTLTLKNNDLILNHYKDKQYICDFIINIDKYTDLSIEINRTFYPGLMERNMAYSFNIYYNHFKQGNNYNEFEKYGLIQINFNKFSLSDDKIMNAFYLIDKDNPLNILSKNLLIIHIDVYKCYKLVYNKTNLDENSKMEKLVACLASTSLSEISSILGSDILEMKEKEKFLNDIASSSQDEDVTKALPFEESIDYRFELLEQDALEKGIEQGIKQGESKKQQEMIEKMLKKNIDIKVISEIANISLKEVEKIAESFRD